MKAKLPSLLFNSADLLMALCAGTRQTRPVPNTIPEEGDLGSDYRCNKPRRTWALGGVAKYLHIFSLIVLALFLNPVPLHAQPSPPSRPVLFVHGWCGSPYDWAPLYTSLIKTLPKSMYPDDTVYLVQYNSLTDGYSIYRENNPVNNPSDLALVTLQDIAAYSSSPRFFVIQFYDPISSTASTDPSNVSRISILNKAFEIKKAIEIIKNITGATSVNIVAHSMGGLDARAYVEDMASKGQCYNYADNYPYYFGECAPGVSDAAYANDVANIITVDTPHSGSPLAATLDPASLLALNVAGAQCQAWDSTNRIELSPLAYGGYGLLESLNYSGKTINNVSPSVNLVPVQAISNYFRIGRAPCRARA